MLTTAYESAWSEIKHHFEPGSPEARAYRLKLADAVLTTGPFEHSDVRELKDAALQKLALEYRQ
jgi:hypothetical protein